MASNENSNDLPGTPDDLAPRRPQRPSPWAHMAEELAEGIRANANLHNELGGAFRGVQQDAYRNWCTFCEGNEEGAANDNGGAPLNESSPNTQ